ncbi:hypothetical protein C1H76_4261 [Elsinoe australis]|uniref:Uncharacterized protein n=1 Tax=Elsinoe australis TaxID=40998 RepID=A0A4U7B0Q9_9PEZI|nr:hypothetical protein C1H76_4261 [Elsinoe australis]
MDIQRSTSVSGSQGDEAYILTRHGEVWQFIDEFYLDHEAPIADVVDEIKAIEELEKRRSRRTKNPIFHPIFLYDDRMYDYVKTLRLAEAALIPAVPDNWVDRLSQLMEFAHGRPMRDLKYLSLSWIYRFSGIDHSIFPRIHTSAAKTLTSISLDWEAVLIDTAPMGRNTSTISRLEGVLVKLFSSTFPCLISFRFRSARPAYQITVPSLYLLDVHRWVIRDPELGFSWNDELTGDLGLAFLERHPHLKELTWPGDRFFASRASSDDQERSSQIIDDLAVQLSRLEVDRCDLPRLPPHHAIVQERLERFIVDTASKLVALRHLKIGGGIPNSYMREMIRSCRRSAIREVALNGMIWPGGLIGSWDNEERTPRPIGESHWIKPLRDNMPFLFEDEPDEDQTALDAIHNLNDGNVDPPTAKYSPYVFQGEPRNEAMLQAVARYYSDTIETLSLLGFIGCPILRNNDHSELDPFLTPLKHFHNLQFLETTVVFDDSAMRRETFVPNHYWENLIAYIERRRPIPSPTRIWGREIFSGDIAEETENAAGRYAKDVFEEFAGHLSGVAKGRQDGVRVRAVIATGYVDLALDVWIGLGEDGQDRLLRWSQLYRWRDEDHVHEHIKRPRYTMRA